MYSLCNQNFDDGRELEEKVRKEFECPVCAEYAAPPIFMCPNSHIICARCWQLCPSCPICRANKIKSRAYTLERIHTFISFPCKFENCTFLGQGFETLSHEKGCEYAPTRCPLADNFQCTVISPYKDLHTHLKEKHYENVYYTKSANFVAKKFSEKCRNEFVIVFYYNDTLFQLKWKYDQNFPAVRCILSKTSPYHPQCGYACKLKFYQKDSIHVTRRVTFKANGLAEFCLFLPDLLEITTAEGDLIYSFEIHSYDTRYRLRLNESDYITITKEE
ncbi:putative E3 ubiquitin-protein ligase SINA-like 9 [Sitophilus oryzae]|uniref:E3 ubiquitin-protein ligase SINA-like 9 n=1 Tax=Sitophilus oryzae TaxID=7048 RepID=A0A6J2XFJ7_SITOR|nr:putative E3 ubiquitin-protein ligase SINA-like 9 [Sitophilus oryzae]